MKQAFEDHSINDPDDIQYHNQRYLSHCGSPLREDALDANIMAAFSGGGVESQAI
jgi:hypothetical protein